MIPGNFSTDSDSNEEDDLKKSAPKLFGHEKNNPFTVPENYFDSLPAIIQERIQAQKKESWYEIILKSLFRPQFAIAILALLLLTFGGIYYFRGHVKQVVPTEIAISDDDLKSADILGTIDESTLIDEMTAFNEVTENPKSSDSEMENYIIDNQTDINQIINEL